MKKCWEIKNQVDSDAAEILLYGVLSDQSWYDDAITPKQFASDLSTLGGKDVTVKINSPGGDVFAAQAIYSQLVGYSGKVTVRIDALAASAAVLIVCAADRVIMPSNALIMIHNPMVWLYDSYDTDKLTKMIGYLDMIKDTIINAYLKKTSIDSKKIAKMMDEETWMNASTAKEYGFVDVIEDVGAVQDAFINHDFLVVNSMNFDLNKFKNIDGLKTVIGKREAQQVGEVKTGAENIVEKIKNILGITAPQNTVKPSAIGVPSEEEIKAAVNLALEAETKRILALEALNDGNLAITEIVNQAKKTKQTAKDIEPYINAIKKHAATNVAEEKPENQKVIETIKSLISDNLNSGAQNILSSGQGTPQAEKEEESRCTEYLAKCINQKNGRERDVRINH